MAAKSVERLASESAAARTRVAATIDEIQARLDPRRIVSEALGKAGDNGRQVIAGATGTVKEHPVAIGVAVGAVGLALLARNRLSKAKVNLGDNVDDYTDYDDGLGYEEDAGIGPAPTEAGRPVLARARESVGGRVDDNPIVSIVLGLLVGAVLGAVFPTSEAERRVMGNAGGKLGDAARRAVDSLGNRS